MTIGLFHHLLDIADIVQHLVRIWREPVREVIFDLPETALLVVMPDDVTDENITGHGKSDNEREGHPEMDEKKVLEEFCVRGDDTEVEHDLGP